MHPNVYCSTIYSSQDIEATKMSINKGMDKEDVVCIFMTEYYSAIKRNEIMPFVATWVELDRDRHTE